LRTSALFVLAYLAGSVNFSILLFRILGKGDPRDAYSKNPGATNVYRQLGLLWAAVVLLLDMGRAVALALICLKLLKMPLVPFGGLALILGNRFPCFHGLRGGKGVANYLGFTLALTPLWAAAGAAAWLALFGIFRLPFIGSLAMVALLAAGTLKACNFDPLAVVAVLATLVLIYWAHGPNIRHQVQKSKKPGI